MTLTTTNSLNDRYILKKCLSAVDTLRTYYAQEAATGRVVMVHLLAPAAPGEVGELRDVLSRCSPVDQRRVIETLVLPDGFAVVTDYIQGLTSFRDWLARRVPGAMTAQGAAAAPAPASPEGGGDFTRLFGPMSKTPTPPLSSPTVPPSPAAPGEFTKLFQSVSPEPHAPAQTPVTAPPPIAQAPAPPFGAAQPVVPPLANARAFDPNGAVGATGAMRAATPPVNPVIAPQAATPSSFTPPAATPPSFAPPAITPPSFTPPAITPPSFAPPAITPPAFAPAAITPPSFGAPPAAPASLASVPVPEAPGLALPSVPPVLPPPVFANPQSGAPLALPLGAAPTPASAAPGGPSDYTRLMRPVTPPPPKPAARQAAAPAAPAVPKRPLPWALIVTLNVVLLLAIAVVLYFALRPAPK